MAVRSKYGAVVHYAREKGYRDGESYSAFDLPGASFSAHRGHGSVVYRGANNGHLEFRCDGCGDAIFVLPGDSEEG